MNRNFLILWQGQFVSQLGSQAFSIASLYWMMEQTGSAGQMGLLMVCSTLPLLLLSPLGGALADRIAKKKILVTCDLLNGLIVLLFSGYLFSGHTEYGVALLYITTFTTSIISSFFSPAVLSAIPEWVEQRRMQAANSMMELSGQVAGLLGQGLGGVLYALLGAPVMFMIDGISFIFSGISECFIRAAAKTKQHKKSLAANCRMLFSDTLEGARYVYANRGMWNFLVGSSFINLLFAPIAVLLPFYVKDVLDKDAAWYGFLLAAMGFGSILGFGIAALIKPNGKARGLFITFCLMALSLLFASLYWVETAPVALVVMALMGVFISIIGVYTLTMIQVASNASVRGRVMGLVQSISGATLPLGMAMGGLLGELTENDTEIIFLGAGLCSALVTVLLPLNTPFRHFICQNTQLR